MTDAGQIFRPPAGKNEASIQILDPVLFRNSPWLREKQSCGSLTRLRKMYSGLRFVAASKDNRNQLVRVWYLGPPSRDTLPRCPIEAVVPASIAVNGRSMPYYEAHRDQFPTDSLTSS